MAEIVKFNTGGTLYFPLIGSATLTWSAAADGSLVGTNLQISVDGGAFANTTNTGTHIGSGLYRWVYTASETTGSQFAVLIAGGSATNVVEPQGFLFRTYGSANAFYPGNILGTALENMTVGTVSELLTGTVSTVTSPVGTVSTVVQLLTGTVTTITAGTVVASTLTDVGTLDDGTLSVNVAQWSGTAVEGTQGGVGVREWAGTVVAGTDGTPVVNMVAINDTAVAHTLVVNVTQAGGANITAAGGRMEVNVSHWKGTAVAGTEGTPFARDPAWTAARSTIDAVPAASTDPLNMLDWMYNVSRNQMDQETGTTKAYNAGNTLIATAVVADDGGSYRRGSFV